MSAGYELSRWRADELANDMTEALPDFALSYSEKTQFDSESGVRLLRRAANNFYSTDRFGRRGEFGELLLHMILTRLYGTEPAISKIFFKDAANDTVKGFDCVHVVPGDQLELWLGEVKFYSDLAPAIRDVIEELRLHSQRDYLRSEFVAITNKIDANWPYADQLRRLLDEDTSLDEVFPRLRIPVLLTYDSETVRAHTSHQPPYIQEFTAEVMAAHERFRDNYTGELLVHLLLLPLQSKRELVTLLHERLLAWQTI